MHGDLTPIYYISGIAGTIGAGLMAMRAYMSKQKDRWISQGGKEANLADKLESNTAAATRNTEAIEKLTNLVTRMDTTLSSHNTRILRIEDVVFSPKSGRSSDGG